MTTYTYTGEQPVTVTGVDGVVQPSATVSFPDDVAVSDAVWRKATGKKAANPDHVSIVGASAAAQDEPIDEPDTDTTDDQTGDQPDTDTEQEG